MNNKNAFIPLKYKVKRYVKYIKISHYPTKEQLEIKNRDPTLYDDKKYKGCRDCHIEPDWLLIYKYLENELVLLLVNTGSHGNVF